MKRIFKLRQKAGAAILAGVLSSILLTNTQAASQGKVGSTSSGSFSISLTIHPTVQSRIAVISESDEEGGVVVTPTDTLGFNNPVSFCVSGRGVSQFSLSSESIDGMSLKVQDASGDITVTDEPSMGLVTDSDCESSPRKLVANASDTFKGSGQSAVLVIHTE